MSALRRQAPAQTGACMQRATRPTPPPAQRICVTRNRWGQPCLAMGAISLCRPRPGGRRSLMCAACIGAHNISDMLSPQAPAPMPSSTKLSSSTLPLSSLTWPLSTLLLLRLNLEFEYLNSHLPLGSTPAAWRETSEVLT